MKPLNIGVLALQGAFAKHISMIRNLGILASEIRKPQELEACDGLIIPGGESTTIFRHMIVGDFLEKIIDFAKHKPIFGTCAGLILMSKEVIADKLKPLGILDITIERNAYGRQAESFSSTVELKLPSGQVHSFPAFFIRAPRIRGCSPEVKVLASLQDEPVLIQQGIHLGATFHPELTTDSAIHQYFISIIKDAKKKGKSVASRDSCKNRPLA